MTAERVRAAAPPGPGAGPAGAIEAAGAEGRRGPMLYSDAIRERWRRPRRRGALPAATAVAEDVNPLCGDRVRFMLSVEAGTVAAARFLGDSCAICTAAADVLAELVEGRSTVEAAALGPADVLDVLRTDVRPTRMRCVTLPLTVLAAALGDEAP
jgi:NifU-like protein involved in Fe-S cluster formation